MLSERITTIFHILGCSNSDIAKCAGCSPSYIRLIHSDKRTYSPKDKPIALLANGIYSFADKENMLKTLRELCNAKGNSREILIPSVVAWLFDTDKKSLPKINTVLSRNKKEEKSRSFGEKLNALLELLELSNARLARTINVDDSYISRFRTGMRSPLPDSEIAKLLAETLYKRAEEQNLMEGISKLSGLSMSPLCDKDTGLICFRSWLYEIHRKSDKLAVDRLLESIDSFSPSSKLPFPEIQSFVTDGILNSSKDLYHGIDGIREAVIRFLGNTMKQGGELWLYSDENMDWMVGDKDFFSKWYALMLACVKRGVKVKIIHTIDRGTDEMISAIQSWMPLYMSGMIEPYVCHRGRDTRFSHTVFLCPGAECIFALHVRDMEKSGCYEYITENARLSIIAQEFDSLFAQSDPLLLIHLGDISKLFFASEKSSKTYAMLPSLSLGTMPNSLLASILESRSINHEKRKCIMDFRQIQHTILNESLRNGVFYEFIPLPDDTELFHNKARLNLAPSLCDEEIYYSPEEFTEHIKAVDKLLEKHTSYRFYAIPELPFNDIQIIFNEKRVIVIKSSIPQAAFVFTEPMIIHAFEDYFEMLMNQYECDRSTVRQIFNRFI